MEVHGRVGGLPVVRLYWSSKAGDGPALPQIAEARGLGPVVPQHGDARTARTGAPVVKLAHSGGQSVKPVRHTGGVVTVTVTVTEGKATLPRAWATARVPDSRALEVHLLPVTERVPALCTAGAGRVEVIVVSRLEDLAGDESVAVSAPHSELLVVATFTVGAALVAHILPMQ